MLFDLFYELATNEITARELLFGSFIFVLIYNV